MAVESRTDLKVEYREVTWENYQYGESGDDEEKDTYGARIRFCRIFGEKKFCRTARFWKCKDDFAVRHIYKTKYQMDICLSNLHVSFTERDSPRKIFSLKKIIYHQCIVKLLTLESVRKTLSCKLFYSL